MANLKDLIVNGAARIIGKTYSSEFVGNVTGNLTGNAATSSKLKTARSLKITDDGTNTSTGVDFDGSDTVTLKLPSTIKASLAGNASTATTADKTAYGISVKDAASNLAVNGWNGSAAGNLTIAGTSPVTTTATGGKITVTHDNSGVTAGTYKSVTVDAKGHVTAGTNPTTLNDYGITDAKIASGVITLGSNTITPLTSASTLEASKVSGTLSADNIPNLDAAKITTGTISVDRLPATALERCVVVADDTARFKLTESSVQVGDTVKVTATKKMYMVVDSDNLSSEAGYEEYFTSTDWSTITNKPSSFTPASHTHNYAGSSSAGGSATSSLSIAAGSRLESATAVDNFLGSGVQFTAFSNYTDIGFGGNDGMIVSFPWPGNTDYGAQIAFDDATTGLVKVRGKNRAWGSWKQLWKEGDSITAPSVTATDGFTGNLTGDVSGNATTATTADKTAYSLSIADGASAPVKAIDSWDGSANKTLTIKGDSPVTTAATANTITITHDKKGPTTATSGGDTDAQAPGFGETFKVTSATVDEYGHTTAFAEHEVTIPSSVATKDANGLMSSADKSKLDSVASDAEVNQNAFSNVTVESTTISADSKTDTLTLAAGNNITLTPDAANGKITISSSYVVASTSASGIVTTDTQAFAGAKTFADTTDSTNNTSGAVIVSGGLGVAKNIYAGAVHNAVWNDLVDCMEVPEDTSLEFGYCYSWKGDSVIKSSHSSKNCIGIHSNTAGFVMGEKKTKTIQAAVAGFALAYVDKLYQEGTPLTWGDGGVLTKCSLLKRVLHPERIIATFYKEEKEEKWHNLPVSGRHWVKIV